MSITVTQGPGVLSPEEYQRRRTGGSASSGMPSLSQMKATSGTRNSNQTSIKPTGAAAPSGGGAPSASNQQASMSQVGMPSRTATGGQRGKSKEQLAAENQAFANNAIGTAAANGFDAMGYVANMSPAELNNLIGAGANLPTYEQRSAAVAAAQRRLSELAPSSPGATNGMGPQGGQGGNAPDTTNPLAMGPDDRGSNEIPQPAGTTPLPGGTGTQDPTAPTRQDGTPYQPGGPSPTTPPRNGMDPNQGQVGSPGGVQAGGTGSNTDGSPATPGGQQPAPTQQGAGMSLQELAAQYGITGGDDNPLIGGTGDGGTQFNPGGGTNPDGTNPTVPQGNQNNGTSPSVYQLRDTNTDRYTTGDQAQDTLGSQVANAVMGGEIPWNDLSELQRDAVLAGIDRRLADDPDYWTRWGTDNPERQAEINFIKEQFEARYGDPTQQARGAAANTINENGSVQGQYDPDTGRAFQAISSDAAAMDDMDVERSDAAMAAENDRSITADELASQRLNDILATDSPLMQLAAQDAVERANRAGMRNSSLAAGAAMAEMTRQASPLAQQEAEATARQEMQSQNLESARRDANAGRDQQNNQFNATQENAAESQEFQTEAARRDANAGRQTQTSVSNAGMANDLLNADRQRDMQYNLQQLAGDQDYAKQELAGQYAADIANIEGQYKQIISDNDTAARMFSSYYDTVASVIGNSEFGRDEAEGRLEAATREFEAGMELILGFEEFDLNASDFNMPEPGSPEYGDWLDNFNFDFARP